MNIIVPKKIVAISDTVKQSERLLIKKENQIGLCETIFTSILGAGYIVLDYGEEVCGGIEISTFLVGKQEQQKIRIRFGESLTETYSDLGQKNSTNNHSIRDFETSLVSYSLMTFGQTGFRFVRIDFIDAVSLSIKSINAKVQRHHLQPIYEYVGEDNEIKDIFLTAKRTIDLCMQDYLWDGIKRDRLVWIGDMHPEMLAVVTLYERQKIIERSMDFVRNQTPLPNWMNRIPMYSLWWIIILADYYSFTNCLDYIQMQAGYLQGLVEQVNKCIKENGELDFPSYFIDWATKDKEDEIAGARAICIWGMKSAIALQAALGADTVYSNDALNKLLKQSIKVKKAKQVIGLKYMALGEISEDEKEKLIVGGAKGMSTFMSYYILKTVAETVNKKTAIKMMKQYYGGMLSVGATTFWEDFDVEWLNGSGRIDELPKPGQKDIHGDFGAYCYKGFRHSLCHGWAAGVLRFIKEYL